MVLADIATKTTYPPILYSGTNISVATTFPPQAPRDTDTPDLGYHYLPIDYAFGGIEADANLTFSAGTVAGWYEGSDAVGLVNVTATFNGTVTAPVYWVRCNTVQDGLSDIGWIAGGMTSWATDIDHASTVQAQFLQCLAMADDNAAFRDDGSSGGGHLIMQASHSEFHHSGPGTYFVTFYFTNCLFDRIGGRSL